ncbi:MAG: beta-ketoacyl-ACP synthase II [Eubacteriales bacterium]
MKRRVVITGLGAVCPIGNSVSEMWENAKNGICGIDYIKSIDIENHEVKVAGEVKNFDPETFMDRMEARRTARFTQFALKAAVEAFEQSGLDKDKTDLLRCGVNIASGIGALSIIEEEHSKGIKRGFDRLSPLFIPSTIVNMAAGAVAIRLGFKGSCICCVTACASATNAIGEAFRSIRDGYTDVMAAGGAEACISHLGIGGFTSMRALSTADDPKRACIPFDKEREGFVMGEGAGVLILEEYEHAKKRGAKILGEIVGYGASCDANHMTAPLEDGSGAAACMTMAIEDAGIKPEDIMYINAHGTGTPLNDKGECRAVKLAFGNHAYNLTMSSTKSMTGHLLGASGGIEAIIALNALRDDFVPPTINFKVKDEECDLDICPNEGKSMKLGYAMSNSLGFGGHNASLVFAKF